MVTSATNFSIIRHGIQHKKERRYRSRARVSRNTMKYSLIIKTMYKASIFIVIIGIVMTSCLYLTRYLISSPYFQIKRIELNGNRVISNTKLIKASGITIGSSNVLLLNTSKTSSAIQSEPWIKAVAIKKYMPDTVVIDIIERTPLALIAKPISYKDKAIDITVYTVYREEFYLIDNNGVILQEIRDISLYPEYADFPIIRGINAPINNSINNKVKAFANTEELIDILKFITFYKGKIENVLKVLYIEPLEKGLLGLTLKDDIKVYITKEEMDKEIDILGDIANRIISKSNRDIEYIDLSFNNKVIIKYKDIQEINL